MAPMIRNPFASALLQKSNANAPKILKIQMGASEKTPREPTVEWNA